MDELGPLFGPFSGFKVAVSRGLVGSKRAILQGGTIYVSPAMLDLIKNASEAELQKLLANIRVVEIPEFPPSGFDLPMATQFPVSLGGNYAAAWADMQAFLDRMGL